MNNKIKFLLLAAVNIICNYAAAVPAYPNPVTVEQPMYLKM
jgi:hypothetical protein